MIYFGSFSSITEVVIGIIVGLIVICFSLNPSSIYSIGFFLSYSTSMPLRLKSKLDGCAYSYIFLISFYSYSILVGSIPIILTISSCY